MKKTVLKKTKRNFVATLVAAMLVSVFPAASFADTPAAKSDNIAEATESVTSNVYSADAAATANTSPSYAVLGANVDAKLMKVEAVPGGAKVVTKNDTEGWEINPGEWPGFIRVNVDDSYIFGGNNRVAVDVKYFDDSTDGTFTVAYNSIETTWKEAETVHLTGTQQWLEHRFILEDAKFANESEGNDFRVAIWAPSMGKSPSPIAIGSIAVEKLKRVTMTGSSKEVGNIFDDEKPTINLEFLNEYDYKKKLSGTYQVYDAAYNRLVTTGKFSVNAAANGKTTVEKLKPDVRDLGVYSLVVDVTDAEGTTAIHQDIPFSIIEKSKKASADSIFGVQTHLAWGGVYDAAKITPLLKNIGAKYIRDEYYWSQVEQTKGVYTFPQGYDQYLDTAIQNGVVPLVELNFGNPLYDGGKAPHSPEAIEAYANYAKAVVSHLKGKVQYFEIWNEWNGSFGNGLGVKEYYALLQAAYKAVKEANPNATVLGGAVAASDYGWLGELLKLGGGDYMDAISFHPYTNAGPEGAQFAETMVRVKQQFKDLGFTKPMWISEVGWSSGNHTEVEQAAFAVQVKTLLLANPGVVDKIFWYDSLNDGMNKEDYESNFGLLSQRGPYAAKPAYAALAANENLLSGAKFVKEYKLDANLRILRFKGSGNKDILAVWSKNGQQTIGLNVGDDKLDTVDLFGNKTSTTAVQNVLSTTVTGTPTYYVGKFGDQLSLAEPTFKAQSEEIPVAAGDTIQVNISRSAAASSLSGTYRATLPEGWQGAAEVKFKKGANADTLTFTAPAQFASDTDTIAIEAFGQNGKKVGDVKIKYTKADPVVVSVAAKPTSAANFDQWELSVRIQNNYSNKPLPAGKLTLQAPADWASGTEPAAYPAIEPGQSQTISLPIPESAIKRGTHVKLHIQPDSGDAIDIDQVMNDLAVAVRDDAKMTIDGDITDEEWGSAQSHTLDQKSQIVNITDWGGPSDLSAEFRTKWDADNLYVAISVTDDVHHQPYTDGSTWQADGIQMGIDPGRIYGAGSRGYNELGYALNNDGSVQKYRWISVPGKFSGAFDTMNVKIKRVDNKTNYEAAIPWADILPSGMTPAEAADIGFSFLINENDGGARRGWIEYMDGIGGAKTPVEFADLALVDLTQ